MPNLMDLKSNQRPDFMPDYVAKRLLPFAVHALACIEVHDALKEEGVTQTLATLCQNDPVLSKEEVVVERYMLCAFGRNSTPVFQRILEKECKLRPEEYQRSVAEAKQVLLVAVSSGK